MWTSRPGGIILPTAAMKCLMPPHSHRHQAKISMGILYWAFQVALLVRNRLSMQETEGTRLRSPGREDPLEEGMATHSSVLAWRIPRTEGPGGPQSMRSQSRTGLK